MDIVLKQTPDSWGDGVTHEEADAAFAILVEMIRHAFPRDTVRAAALCEYVGRQALAVYGDDGMRDERYEDSVDNVIQNVWVDALEQACTGESHA